MHPQTSSTVSLSGIDTTRSLRTDDELQRLVAAVHGSRSEAQETGWLEWKSGLDLTKAAGKFAVAKAVLGFANRSVEDARLTCGGVAYMVVGVEPGTASGISAIDHADLTQGIKTYASTPRFTPRTFQFSGVEVLVVVVEPPEPGDPIHTLQKQYDKFGAGVVFHRGHARTAPAGPKEIEMLSERLLRGVRHQDIDLSVRCTVDHLTRLNADPDLLEDWLRRHEAHVRANSDKPPERPAPRPEPRNPREITQFAAEDSMWLLRRYADPKDAEEFDQRVKSYVAQMRRRLPGNVLGDIVRDERANKVRFQVANVADDPVSRVQLTVRVRKAGLLVYTSPPNARDLPSPPKWPSPLDGITAGIDPALALGVVRAQPLDFPHGSGAVVQTDDDSFEVTWDVGDLRPREQSRAFTISIVPGPHAPEQIDVEMVVSAMDRRGIKTVTAPITVSADAWNLDHFRPAAPAS